MSYPNYPKVSVITNNEKTDVEILQDSLVECKDSGKLCKPFVRSGGNFAGNSFYLDTRFDWIIGRDNEKDLILIPFKKET